MVKLSAEDYEYRRTENSVSSINYHFIFVPKRRKAVLIGDIALRMQSIIFGLVEEHGWKLIALEVNARPCSPCSLIRLPTNLLLILLDGSKEGLLNCCEMSFPTLKRLPSLWSPSYFVATTGKVSTDTIRKYIESQKGK